MKTRSGGARLKPAARKNGAVRRPDPHTHNPHTIRNLPPSTRDPHTADVLANELRNVVKLAERTPGTPNPEVLLDKQVHGFRLVLTRTSIVESHQVTLSPRELEIARMIGKGLPKKMIADLLDISTWTVGTHLRRIFAKLSVPSRAAMVAKLLKNSVFLSIELLISLA